MSAPRPLEDELLAPVEWEIARALAQLGVEGDHAARLELLEAVACRLAGFDLDDYRALGGATDALGSGTPHGPIGPDPAPPRAAIGSRTPRHAPTSATPPATLGSSALHGAARGVLAALEATPIPAALALAALAREPLTHSERRRAGCYHTDFRLARFLARRAVALKPLRRGELVIDPASGSGILLAALALARGDGGRRALEDFVRHSACAADLSPVALRGVKIALTPLAREVRSVAALGRRLRAGDSLAGGASAWRDVAPEGFDMVIGNPPWEKLKISRHEHLAALGALRHYGEDYGTHQGLDELPGARLELAAYVRSLEYELAGRGEPDLFKLFLALSSALVRHGGQIAVLVPAGLIRSEGTRPLREHLFAAAPELRIAVLDNRARFFPIDSRAKFLAVNALIAPTADAAPLVLEHASGTGASVATTGAARLDRRELARRRPDLSVPEVRSDAEWRLFRRLARSGVALGDPTGPWRLRLAREVDMTNDRQLFERVRSNGEVALVEGRMVHQFRHTAKAYVSGTGRRADWAWQAPGEGECAPQFYIDPRALPDAVRERVSARRVGFCDISGQTNERSMLAASIPAGVACGNKVPTIAFGEMAHDEELVAGVFLAIANSFAFDWLLRRVLTTTVNYFLLLSVPFPRLALGGPRAARLAELAHEVERRYATGADPDAPSLAALRAELDARAMEAYRIGPRAAELILRDFPLLDRGQPPLAGEERSTVTRDRVLLELARRRGREPKALAARVDAALVEGAEPYVPSQMARALRTSADLAAA